MAFLGPMVRWGGQFITGATSTCIGSMGSFVGADQKSNLIWRWTLAPLCVTASTGFDDSTPGFYVVEEYSWNYGICFRKLAKCWLASHPSMKPPVAWLQFGCRGKQLSCGILLRVRCLEPSPTAWHLMFGLEYCAKQSKKVWCQDKGQTGQTQKSIDQNWSIIGIIL